MQLWFDWMYSFRFARQGSRRSNKWNKKLHEREIHSGCDAGCYEYGMVYCCLVKFKSFY